MSDTQNLTDKHGKSIRVAKEVDGPAGRFAVYYTEPEKLAGFTQFIDIAGERVFFHTEIGEEFAGAGLGSKLISNALAATDAEGQETVAVCPFVKGWLERNEFEGRWRKPSPADIQKLQQALG